MTEPQTPATVIATYNVHGFVGREGRVDPDRTFRVIGELRADVVALQEVHALPGARDLADLAKDAGYELLLGATLQRDGADFGNALLVRLPLEGVEHHDLSIAGREPRAAIDARLRSGGDTLRVVAVHLGLRAGERRMQVKRLADRLAQQAGEHVTVLLGDFNEWGPRARRLVPLARCVGPFSRRPTFPARRALLPLDRIAVRPASALEELQVLASPLARMASDHLPLRARVRTPLSRGSAR